MPIFIARYPDPSPYRPYLTHPSSSDTPRQTPHNNMASLAADFDVETLWTEKDQAAVDKWRAAKEKQYAVEVRDTRRRHESKRHVDRRETARRVRE